MIYSSDKFRQKFVKLGKEYQDKVISIINRYNMLSLEERPAYLVSLCGKNGNSKWTGISKTLYHLYPQKGNTTHRLFYCYATDLEPDIRTKTQIHEGLVLIDYTITKNEEFRAAKNYEKGNIKYYQIFDPPVTVVGNQTQQTNTPFFWFCLTSKQNEVLEAKQPLLVKGSAGAGKTLISFELFKHWITYTDMQKILYITYTDNLLNLAKKTLTDDGLVFEENGRFDCIKFEDIYNNNDIPKIIKEKEARIIISSILEKLVKSNKLPDKLIFTDYFIYSYIRGLTKGRFKVIVNDFLDINFLEKSIFSSMKSSTLTSSEQSKVFRCLIEVLKDDYITYDTYRKTVKLKLLSSLHKKDKEKLNQKLDLLFNQDFNFDIINESRVSRNEYDFLSRDDVTGELIKDGLTSNEVKLVLEITDRYNEILKNRGLFDDNDYAKYLLNKDFNDKEKYDAIIVDEVQDLTEIQIEAIVKLTKDGSDNISFFGDPNQTINPTVYDYGRFNSFVYNKTSSINREYLKETHRCGPNLLEYINHLTRLRSEFQITNEREDLKEEVSAVNKIDTYWACLIENNYKINYVLEMFVNAVDCYLIVDNNTTRSKLIKRINDMTDNEHDEYLASQIITVQDAKGLESKNVIMYNLISDNLAIYENILNENNKVSSMTFNKLYVSCTRAQDSLLICEENLTESKDIRDKLFYFNKKSMAENIAEDDISLYLSISFDPEVFYDQALNAIDDYNYIKAMKKNNIALQNIVNQFDYTKQTKEEHTFAFLEEFLRTSQVYGRLLHNIDIRRKTKVDEYFSLFEKMYNELNNVNQFNETELQTIKTRLDLFKNCMKTGKLCSERTEFDEYISLMEDKDVKDYIIRFILLDDYNCSIHAIERLKDVNSKLSLTSIAKYIFNLISFDEIIESIGSMAKLSEKISSKIVIETNLINDYFEHFEIEIFEMEEMING